MKRVLTLSLIFCTLLLILTGCGKKEERFDMKLSTIAEKIYDGMENMPVMDTIELTKENAAQYLGTDKINFKEGIVSEAKINTLAHSIVILRAEKTSDVEDIKKEIKANANPKKWICVEAESVIVENKQDVIILIMSNETHASMIQNNFKNLK